MSEVVDLKSQRKKTNRRVAEEELPIILSAIETAKRALKALHEKKKLCERILKEE